MAERWHRPAVRIVAGVLALGVLVGFIVFGAGADRMVEALAGLGPRRVASIALVAVAPIMAWGLGFRLVLRGVGREVPHPRAVLLFAATLFANSVTPFGQAGGDPVSGAVVAESGHLAYERGLAAVVSINALNRLAAIALGFLGVGYLGVRGAGGGPLRSAAIAVVGALALLALLGLVAWRVGSTLESLLARGTVAALDVPLRLVPGVRPPTPSAVRGRIRGFVDAVARVAASPRRLGAVFSLCVLGQVFVASILWLALASLGAGPDLAVVVFVVPVAKLAGLAPTPGGFGSAEALIAGLLVALTPVSPAVAGAAAILYRAAAFWLPAVLGGLAMAWVLLVEGDPTAIHDVPRPDGRPSPFLVILGGVGLFCAWGLWVVHAHRMLLEPADPIVHLARDVSVGAVLAAVGWLAVRLGYRVG